MKILMILLLLPTSFCNALYCYRCDSQVDIDCEYYPAPLSAYEDCDDLPASRMYSRKMYTTEMKKKIFIRYRYKICPLLETTIEETIPWSPSPLEEGQYICGKAVTHGPTGVRVRRGCTPDIFLSGTNACVQVHPHGNTDVACYCTTDLCNTGNPLAHRTPFLRLLGGLVLLSFVRMQQLQHHLL